MLESNPRSDLVDKFHSIELAKGDATLTFYTRGGATKIYLDIPELVDSSFAAEPSCPTCQRCVCGCSCGPDCAEREPVVLTRTTSVVVKRPRVVEPSEEDIQV